jgi:anti-sigma factor RsiW
MHDPCRRLLELLHDFINGELPPDEIANLQAHIEACPPCEVYVSTYRLTITMTRQLPPSEIPSDVADRLLRALQRESGGKG